MIEVVSKERCDIMDMTVELFDSIINTSQDCVFWKDSKRRFLGVNQAFLDFYGFESADVLIGKTDEDMGWHSDPEPFMLDELRVLSGHSTYKVQGKCMIRGEERDIIASKRPLYENGKIVGLVGSFIDITDALRRHGLRDDVQVVYTTEKLRMYPYWDKLLDDTAIDEIIDPLTGILSRTYAMDFVRSLIMNGTPFSFSILDLDNFKFINDNFGHHNGDIVLKNVTKALAEYTDGYALVGRFGGDELLLINLSFINRNENEAFFRNLYSDRSVFRKDVSLEDGKTYVTCTSGCASYPEDAKNLTDLFELVDKALYIGKNRGRNCYTIYDPDKHKDVVIRKIAKHDIHSDMITMRSVFEKSEDTMSGLNALMPFLTDNLQIPELYYIDGAGILKAVHDREIYMTAGDIVNIMSEDVFCCSFLSEIKNDSPILFEALRKQGIESFIIVRTGDEKGAFDYLICAAKRKYRIWQENECALMYYLGTLVSNS